MTDMAIPPEAVGAALDVVMDDGHNGIECRPDRNLEKTVQAALEAALPHLRPLVEEQELRLATSVAMALGRLEMREEIIRALVDEGASLRAIGIARDTGKGDSA